MRLPPTCRGWLVAVALALVTAAPRAGTTLDHAAAVHVLNRLTFGATESTVSVLRSAGSSAGWRCSSGPPS